MNIRSIKIQIGVAVLSALLILGFNQRVIPYKSQQQLSYDQWFSQIEPLLLNGEIDPPKRPEIELSFVPDSKSPNGNDSPRQLKLSVNSNPNSNEQVLRVLQLIKEANFFSIGKSRVGQALDLARSGDVILRIKQDSIDFETSIGKDTLANNLTSQNMLKLLQIYAQQQQQALQQSASLGKASRPTDNKRNKHK